MVPLFAWFVIVQPADVARLGPMAVRFHSVMGLAFVSLALFWTLFYLRRGLLGRPGPKLGGWARRMHPVVHKTLIWGIFTVAVTGLLIGLTSTVQLWAGGIVPIAVPLDLPRAHRWVGLIHSIQFYGFILSPSSSSSAWRLSPPCMQDFTSGVTTPCGTTLCGLSPPRSCTVFCDAPLVSMVSLLYV